MAKNHAFGVRGGEKLARMGLAWFISYAYYEKADKSHLAWKKANTYPTRIAAYNAARSYHAEWIEYAQTADGTKLKKNLIGLDQVTIKRMAKILSACDPQKTAVTVKRRYAETLF